MQLHHDHVDKEQRVPDTGHRQGIANPKSSVTVQACRQWKSCLAGVMLVSKLMVSGGEYAAAATVQVEESGVGTSESGMAQDSICQVPLSRSKTAAEKLPQTMRRQQWQGSTERCATTAATPDSSQSSRAINGSARHRPVELQSHPETTCQGYEVPGGLVASPPCPDACCCARC